MALIAGKDFQITGWYNEQGKLDEAPSKAGSYYVMADMLATQEKHIRMLEMCLAQLESRLSERDRKANRGNQATSAQRHRERS